MRLSKKGLLSTGLLLIGVSACSPASHRPPEAATSFGPGYAPAYPPMRQTVTEPQQDDPDFSTEVAPGQVMLPNPRYK